MHALGGNSCPGDSLTTAGSLIVDPPAVADRGIVGPDPAVGDVAHRDIAIARWRGADPDLHLIALSESAIVHQPLDAQAALHQGHGLLALGAGGLLQAGVARRLDAGLLALDIPRLLAQLVADLNATRGGPVIGDDNLDGAAVGLLGGRPDGHEREEEYEQNGFHHGIRNFALLTALWVRCQTSPGRECRLALAMATPPVMPFLPKKNSM